jgi:CubicO group peptidase (beta-lactamase class C family)
MIDGSEVGGLLDGDESALERLLAEGIEEGIFTGAAAAVGSSDGVTWATTVGERDPRAGEPVTPETLFDAASTTKAIVTATVILRLVEEGVLALSDPLAEHVPPLEGTDRGEIPLRHLLTHTSGLQPYHFDPDWESPEAAREAIYDADLLAAGVDEKFEYSCLNYVHLADAARRATDISFAKLAERYVFEPAGMERARMGPLVDEALPVTVTYEADWAEETFRGEINDPIARTLEGESGNAGLFATVNDFSAFAVGLLNDGRGESGRIFAPATVDRMTDDWTPDCDRPHGLGWRLARECYPAPNWSRSSFGHTGYTGTSIWLDPVHDRFAVLLTNEVYCGKERGMVRLRERFHGAVAGERF